MSAEILNLEEKLRWADASPEPDTSGVLEELLAEDVILIGPQGQLIDRNFVIAAHKYPQKQTFSRADIHDQQLRTLEGSVVVTCRGDFEVGGQRFQLRFLRVWRKTNGRWQVAAASVTGIA